MIRRHGALLLAIAALAAAPPAQAQTAADLTPRPTPATLPGNAEILETIRELTSRGPRRVGTSGIDFAVDYIAGKLRSYGLTGVHVEETPTYSWAALRHELLVGGRPVDAFPVAYSQSPSATAVGHTSTPGGGLRAPLVDVGAGTPADMAARDVKGKIVMFDLKFLVPLAGFALFTEFLWDPENTMALSPRTLTTANPFITTYTDVAEAAMDAGAVGFVGVLTDYFDSNQYYNEFYRRLNVDIPGMWITKKEGDHVRAQLARDSSTEASMTLETRRAETAGHVVVGYLEGKSPDTIMIQSHHDSQFDGAVEDGSGVAEVLALAKHYATQPRKSREKSLMFATFDTHFSGYQAHFAFTKRHVTHRDPRREPHRLVANVTLEHVGKAASAGPDGELVVSELAEPRGIFENVNPLLKGELIGAVVRNDLRRTAILNGTPFQPIGVPTDASMVLSAGVPAVNLIAGPLYLYDRADTLDKVLVDELQPVAKAFVEITDALDEAPSETIGLLPLAVSAPLGVETLRHLGGNKGSEVSVDRVEVAAAPRSCTAARRGRAVTAARLRRSGRMKVLTFRARRSQRVRIVVRHRGGRRERLRRPRRLRACRRYRIPLPASARSVRISGRGGAVAVRLRR